MSNTITAYFKGRVGVAESVYQNDYGMIMVFDDIELPAHFDCYFSMLNQDESFPGVGADNRVAIPNEVLANPGAVTVHIPLHTGANDSEVEYIVYFKVIGRARPMDDGTPEQMTAIEQAIALLNHNNIKDNVYSWLDEHPEATTTVQDGSITKEKLSDDLVDQFISGDYNITRFNNARGQETFVYWRFISKDYTPMVAYSNTVDYAVKLANEEGATCAINASRWRTATNAFYGYFQVGENVLNDNEFEDSSISTDSRYILCCKDGILSAQPIRKSTQELMAEEYDWALTGFETLIVDGQPTDRANPETETETETSDFHPRSFIAQTYGGDYIVGSCDGRSRRTNGFTLPDVYRFLTSLGHQIRFAYSLDGGGSVSLVEKGERVNSYINNENRAVKSVIYFKKPNAYYNGLLRKGVSNIENNYRARVNSYYDCQGDISATSSGTTKELGFYSIESLLRQAYLRFQEDRFFLGFDHDFSYSETPYNLLDVGRSYFQYNNINRYLPKASNSEIDYRDEIPSLASTGIYNVNILTAAKAVELGLTAEDYGQGVYITFRTSANIGIFLTRANIWYRYDNSVWKRIGFASEESAGD